MYTDPMRFFECTNIVRFGTSTSALSAITLLVTSKIFTPSTTLRMVATLLLDLVIELLDCGIFTTTNAC